MSDDEAATTTPKLYGLAVAAKAAGLPRRQLDLWCRDGVFEPTSKDPRRFSVGDIVTLRALAGLRALGLPLPVLQQVAQRLKAREAWPRERVKVNYLIGGRIEVFRAREAAPSLPCVTITLDGHAASVDALNVIQREAAK